MKKIDPGQKKHSRFSASASKRWLNCPGSIALSDKAPRPPESKYAEEGTTAHEVLEKLLVNRKNWPAVARKMHQRKEYPAYMINFAGDAVEEIEKLIGSNAVELLTETKVSLHFINEEMFGTVDCAIVDHFGTLYVIDYKFGAGIMVDPKYNSQLLYYALGIAHKYDFNFARVAIVIIQPRITHALGSVRSWTVSIPYLKRWESIFRSGVEAASKPNAKLNAGTEWCFFCPAKTICPEFKNAEKNESHNRAVKDFDDIVE